LTRELSMSNIIRLWDTYLSRGAKCDADYHVNVCTALLTTFSEPITAMDFSKGIQFLQHMYECTDEWGDKELWELIARTEWVEERKNLFDFFAVVCLAVMLAVIIVAFVCSLLLSILLSLAACQTQPEEDL